mgnify:CR=1 FL=1
MNLSKMHLLEFDRLIQLLESPGFTELRFELLERPPTLLATLHGLLMLLPQVKRPIWPNFGQRTYFGNFVRLSVAGPENDQMLKFNSAYFERNHYLIE